MTNINVWISKLKLAYSEWKKKEADKITMLVFKFAVIILTYGVMINIIATGIFNSPFWIGSVFGYGLLFYFVTDEFPDWIRKLRRAR